MTTTPWGPSQTSKKYMRGIVSYTTASHGGMHVSPTVNALIHDAWRKSKGWYEEDCDWAIVALTFPHLFSEDAIKQAHFTAKDYYPDAYTRVTGNKVEESESYVLRQRADSERYKDRFIAVSCFGELAAKVPVGFVGVCAVRGGRGPNGGYDLTAEKWFLVTAEDYERRDLRTSLGMLVPEDAKEIAPL